MTEEELRAFLAERKVTPDKINELVDGLSAKGVQAFEAQFGRPISDDAQAEEIAKRNRRLFVEEISTNEAGGMTWNTAKNLLDQ